MGISKEEAIKALQTRESVFVAYTQATKLPYVTCDDETYNDQAWVFATEEEIKAFGQKCLEDKILIMGMRYDRKDYPRFYGTLYAIGVNTILWNDGGEQIEIDLTDIAKQADMSKLDPARRPLFNASLQLSGIYFMQELRRPIKPEERKNMREMEEELIANIVKADFLVAMIVDEKDPKKVNVPFIKNKAGEMLQPVFSDVMEFEKFARGQKMRAAKMPFSKLPGILMEQSVGFVLNPGGFNLVMNKEMMKRLAPTEA